MALARNNPHQHQCVPGWCSLRYVLIIVLLTSVVTTIVSADDDTERSHPHTPYKMSTSADSSPEETDARTEETNSDDANENYPYDDDSEGASLLAEAGANTNPEEVILEPGSTDYDNVVSKAPEESLQKDIERPKKHTEEEIEDEDDFCQDDYVDSAYFNGYDTILTRGDRLWYYYKDQHRLSKAYDQRRFTQGEIIQMDTDKCDLQVRHHTPHTHTDRAL